MGSWRSSKGEAAAQHHTLIATDNWRMETEVSSLRPSLVLSWGPWSLRLGLRHTTAPPTTALAQLCFLKKFYLWVPGFPGKCKSPTQPCLCKWFPKNHADAFSPSHSAMNPSRNLLGLPEERITVPFSALQDALLLHESLPPTSHSVPCVVLPVSFCMFQTCAIPLATRGPRARQLPLWGKPGMLIWARQIQP